MRKKCDYSAEIGNKSGLKASIMTIIIAVPVLEQDSRMLFETVHG